VGSSVFEFENLSFAYPRTSAAALDSVSFKVDKGDAFALLGPNGAGKTTLLRLLCGRLPATHGQIRIAENLRNADGSLNLATCGILLENPGIYPKLSIEEYLSFFAGFYALKDTRERIRSLAKALEISDVSIRLGALSQGTKQKVQVIRALLHRPQVLLLDEPVANLDPGSRSAVWSLLGDWKKETGGTLLISSHILSEMDKYADSFAIISKGKLQKAGRMDSLQINEMIVRLKMKEEMNGKPVDAAAIQNALNAAGISLEVLGVEKSKLLLERVYKGVVENAEND